MLPPHQPTSGGCKPLHPSKRTALSEIPRPARLWPLLQAGKRWARFARETSPITPKAACDTLVQSIRFSSQYCGGHLAVTFPLEATSFRQLNLSIVQKIGVPPGARLFWQGSMHRPIVCFGDRPLGAVPEEHRPWVELLLRQGLGFRMARVLPGPASDRLGCVVAAWEVDRLLDRYIHGRWLQNG